jgi:hypothetical protein
MELDDVSLLLAMLAAELPVWAAFGYDAAARGMSALLIVSHW